MFVLVIVTVLLGMVGERREEDLVLRKRQSSHTIDLCREAGRDPEGLFSLISVTDNCYPNFQISLTPKSETFKEVLCLVKIERNRGHYIIFFHSIPLYFLISLSPNMSHGNSFLSLLVSLACRTPGGMLLDFYVLIYFKKVKLNWNMENLRNLILLANKYNECTLVNTQ